MVSIWPGKHKSKITEIISSGREADFAEVGNSVSIVLNDEIDIERGSVIANLDSSLNDNVEFDASIVWFSKENLLLDKNQKEFLIKLNHNLVNSKITDLNYVLDINNFNEDNAAEVSQNDIANVRFKLSKKIPFDLFENAKHSGSFLLIDKVTNETLACGIIQKTITTEKHHELSDEEKYKQFMAEVIKLGEKYFQINIENK